MLRSLREVCSFVHVSAEAGLEMLASVLNPEQMAEHLRASGVVETRQRKLRMLLAVWLVIAMNLYADDAEADVLKVLLRGPHLLWLGACQRRADNDAIRARWGQWGLAPPGG